MVPLPVGVAVWLLLLWCKPIHVNTHDVVMQLVILQGTLILIFGFGLDFVFRFFDDIESRR